MSRHRKLCRNKVEKLKVKIFVTTSSKSVGTKDEEERTEYWSRQRKVCCDSFQKQKSMRS